MPEPLGMGGAGAGARRRGRGRSATGKGGVVAEMRRRRRRRALGCQLEGCGVQKAAQEPEVRPLHVGVWRVPCKLPACLLQQLQRRPANPAPPPPPPCKTPKPSVLRTVGVGAGGGGAAGRAAVAARRLATEGAGPAGSLTIILRGLGGLGQFVFMQWHGETAASFVDDDDDL